MQTRIRKPSPKREDAFLVTFPLEEELKKWDDVEFHLKSHEVVLTIAVERKWQC